MTYWLLFGALLVVGGGIPLAATKDTELADAALTMAATGLLVLLILTLLEVIAR